MDSNFIAIILSLLVISIGMLFYTLWAIKVYPSPVPKVLVWICVPIASFSAYFLLNMLKTLPAIFIAAGVLVFLAYSLLLRLPFRFALNCATHLLFIYFFFLSVITGAVSLLYEKNIYHILLLPETSRLVFLFASGAFMVFCIFYFLKSNPLPVKALTENRFVFKYYIIIECLIVVFMLYTCFDYYVNGDSIWPSVWHLVSAVIMLAIFMTSRIAADKIVSTLHESIRRDRQAELLANQQAYVESIRSESNTVNRLHHDYNEMLMTVDFLAQKADTEKIKEYVQKAQLQLEEIRPKFKPLSNNAVMNSLLFSASALCESKGIGFDASLYMPESLEISSNDLYSVVQELVKNAIEACEKQSDGERQIKLSSEVSNNWLTIKIQNTYDGYVTMSGNLPDITAINEKSYRGLGLRLVEKTVVNNNGIFFCEPKNKEHIFIVSLMFPY